VSHGYKRWYDLDPVLSEVINLLQNYQNELRAQAEIFLAEIEKKVAGYALYYPVFGSFSAAGRVHLEDIYIREEFRNQGFGKTFFTFIADQILKEGFAGMEWSCLDWNESALSFYDHIGAHREKGREYLFMSEEELISLTEQAQY
jgi:GNAT superfamily N-acetyltransferase